MNYAIFDIDNCIADDEWRIQFIDWTPGLDPDARYGKYHMHCGNDEPRNMGVVLGLMFDEDVQPVFFTARPEAVRTTTEHWLFKHFGIAKPVMLMRDNGCFVPSVQLKARMLDRMRKEMNADDRIVAAFDDRQDIVDMYLRQGIPAQVLKVHDTCAYTNPHSLEKLNG